MIATHREFRQLNGLEGEDRWGVYRQFGGERCVCGGRCQKCRGGLRGHIGAFGAIGPDTGAVLAAEEALQRAPSGWSGIGRAVAVGVATGTLLYVATHLVDSLLGFRR